MKNCVSCGKEIENSFNHCPYCNSIQEVRNAFEDSTTFSDIIEKFWKYKKQIMITSSVLLILFIALTFIIVQNNKQAAKEAKTKALVFSLKELENACERYHSFENLSEIVASLDRIDVNKNYGTLSTVLGDNLDGFINSSIELGSAYSYVRQMDQNMSSKIIELEEKEKDLITQLLQVNQYEKSSFVIARRFETLNGKGVYEAVKGWFEKCVLLADEELIKAERGLNPVVTLWVKSIGDKVYSVTNSNAFRAYNTNEYYPTYEAINIDFVSLKKELEQTKQSLEMQYKNKDAEYIRIKDFTDKNVKPHVEKIVSILEKMKSK